MNEHRQFANFLYFQIFLNLFLTVIAAPDILPIQVDGNVYQIQEQSAIVYKKLPEAFWRYSTYKQDGSLAETYILNGFQDLAQSFYFVEQNNFLNFYTQDNPNFQILDLGKLTSQQPGYLQINPVFLKSQCTQVKIIRKYGSCYFYICSNPKIFFYELSINQLQTSTTSLSYSSIDMTQDYIMLYPSLLCYKGNIFTQFSSLTATSYQLIDQNYDFFLLDYSNFCIANLAVQTQTFSCKYSYFVGSSKSNLLLTKVFESNRKQLVFTWILDNSNPYYLRYEVFDVTNLQMITRDFANFEDITNSQTIIQYENIMFLSKGYKWNIAYNPQNNSIIGNQRSVTLSHQYLLVNEPFYNLNFQQGFTIFLNYDNSTNYLLDFRDVMNLNCPSGQHIQLDFTCSNSNCPSFSYLDKSKNKCYCDTNAFYSPSENSCTCYYGFTPSADNQTCVCQNGYYVISGYCQQCNDDCQNCYGPSSTNCLTCKSGKYLFSDSCLNCNTTGQIIQAQNCVCQSNYYQNGIQCSKCHISCSTCSGPNLNNCLTCPTNQYLYPDYSCSSCNPAGYFIQNQNCVPCSANCQTCDGSSFNNCTSCKSGYYLFENNQCNNYCDTGFYIDGFKCLQCNAQCLTCQGPLPTDCLTCPLGKFLFPDNFCKYCNIQDGFFISGTRCIPCFLGCKTCKGPLTTDCLTCSEQKYLFVDNTCLPCITGDGYFIKNIYCLPCDQTCQTCFGENKNQCQSCFENSLLYQSVCEEQYYNYNSRYFSNQKIEQVQQYFQTLEQISFSSTIIQSILLNMISSSSFSLIANGFNSQKASFLILINTKLPAQIYKVLIQFKSQFPSMQYQYLNAYESMLDQSDKQYQDARYRLVNLSFSILQSCEKRG